MLWFPATVSPEMVWTSQSRAGGPVLVSHCSAWPRWSKHSPVLAQRNLLLAPGLGHPDSGKRLQPSPGAAPSSLSSSHCTKPSQMNLSSQRSPPHSQPSLVSSPARTTTAPRLTIRSIHIFTYIYPRPCSHLMP